jgi:hypothetical protein
MRALIIGEPERQAISALKARAATSVIDAAAAMQGDPDKVRQENRSLTILLPRGFEVTYTHERQPSGLYHHLSVSVDQRDRMPSPEAVDMIMEAFGLEPAHLAEHLQPRPKVPDKMRLETAVWTEDFEPGRTAVNVLQRMEPTR